MTSSRMQAALYIREKQKQRVKKFRRGRFELPSHVATKDIAPFPPYPPNTWVSFAWRHNLFLFWRHVTLWRRLYLYLSFCLFVSLSSEMNDRSFARPLIEACLCCCVLLMLVFLLFSHRFCNIHNIDDTRIIVSNYFGALSKYMYFHKTNTFAVRSQFY